MVDDSTDGQGATSDAAGEGLSRLDALDLAVTQLADAVEALASAVQRGAHKDEIDGVVDQIETARRLIGTGD